MSEEIKDYLEESVYSYLEKISEPTPIPSGGAAFGLTGALSSALAAMIANFSSLNLKMEKFKSINENFSELFDYGIEVFERLIKQDMFAYILLSEDLANRTLDEKTKEERVRNSLIRACEPPMTLIETASKLATALETLSQTCSKSLLSDIGVSASLLEAAINSSWLTVLVNFNSVKDPDETLIKQIEETKIKKDNSVSLLNNIFLETQKYLENDL